MRRVSLALVISVVLHVGLVVAAVGISTWQLFSMTPQIRVQTIAIDLVKDLPLGGPPAKAAENASEPPVPVRRPRQHRISHAGDGVTVAAAPDAGAPAPKADAGPGVKRDAQVPDGGGSVDGGRRRPGDLRSNGPAGSRVVALLHMDRLRASPDSEKTIAAVDQLLMLLPDRRRLIEGTGLELYRDFDSLLIATPNPADAAVTFLAARHHLGEAAMKAGLDRGAKAANKPIRWRPIDGRPVGLRQQANAGAPNAVSFDRDDRILVLPEPNMAIIATPAYASQLLGVDPENPTGKSPTSADAGAGPARTMPRIDWRDIIDRIDAEDSAVPEDAAFMMSATNVFGSALPAATIVVPASRGANEDMPTPAATSSPVPEVLTLVAGAQPPYIQLIAEFKSEADAERWEQDLPTWRRRLLGNPIVLISGFSPLIRRATISREGSTLEVRVDASLDEIQRLLNVVANLARTTFSGSRSERF